jgi:exopolyphosphatase/pppGpp-phosphohydrolase
VSLWATRSWDPINDTRHAARVGELLADLTKDIPAVSAIHVVGTAAARRDPDVAGAIAAACGTMGWTYETLSHEAEAALIQSAFGGRVDCDIINVGGGSVQIVGADGRVSLLGFGISDLNRLFALNAEPAERQVRAATEFVRDRLPALERPFVYSGGELSYLTKLGADVGPGGRCTGEEFERVARLADAMTADELVAVSPFDAAWSTGAVASNAIVRACLERCGAGFYYASDVNIADGIIASLAGRSSDAANPGF